jgi:hypothetical protein|nr:MAG TPA: hypothetical protein [Caudoviricetes sp.]
MTKTRQSNGTLSFVNDYLDEWREMAKEKTNDVDEVVSFINDCINKLQSMTNFEIYSRETNVRGGSFDMNCEMENDEYGFIRVYAEFEDGSYCASLTYIDDNHEIIDDQISVKKKSTIISKMQAFVDSVEQKIGK